MDIECRNIPIHSPIIPWSYSICWTMQEIIPGLFLGPYSVALKNCRNQLLDQGITHIICVRQPIEAHFVKPHFNDAIFTYLILDIVDMATENIIRFFPKVKQFVDDALSKNAKVLIHGNTGTSRSATLVLAYIMEKLGLTCRDAFMLVKERRACIKPNEGFFAQLIEYEPIYKAKQIFERGESSSDHQRHKRKSEHLTEIVDVDLIQPPSSPVNGDHEDISMKELEIYCRQFNLL
ncbi:hypothetical protein PPYR_07275 [Photinus pyralis]|uniref:Tyrosine-protein phosphatase domain-containing protein n=1 Tax=Photinus pyralis TaxID=7054 RepID=A0A1Y1K893_PHOPY|nr:serine/threonine/tyrosine-interacting protein-like [Photinus pyralis]KAB0799395.1 hypothetical protein PPYR_07275 [Photinus pyralis]